MLTGLNHLTLTVRDLERSVSFYRDLLGFCHHVSWLRGAYLSLGSLWLCLTVGDAQPSQDYSHVAFGIQADDFPVMLEKLQHSNVKEWQPNTSEGASFYFRDPDGHKLELHVGNLQTRLSSLRAQPYEGLKWIDR